MARAHKIERKQTGRARMRAEMVEITQGMHRAGVVDDAGLEKMTIAMFGDALPKVADLSPAEIVRVGEKVGVSEAVMAGFLNVAVFDAQPVGARRAPAYRHRAETPACGQGQGAGARFAFRAAKTREIVTKYRQGRRTGGFRFCPVTVRPCRRRR